METQLFISVIILANFKTRIGKQEKTIWSTSWDIQAPWLFLWHHQHALLVYIKTMTYNGAFLRAKKEYIHPR